MMSVGEVKDLLKCFKSNSKLGETTSIWFFEYVRTLKMRKEDFKKDIDMAHSIKSSRSTYIHVEENRILAKKFIYNQV
jgi:hypothetical protein